MSVQLLQADKETIAAIATPLGEGGIGIIRISGAKARGILEKVFVPQRPVAQWRSHRLVFGHCVDGSGAMLDEVLVAWMAQGHSYTGEDVVELHAHGGRLNLLQLLREVLAHGARPAEAGEFTRRAFLHGRIDLTRAEAIADLIAARNEQALRIARDHLQGRLQGYLDELADRSLMLAAQVESWIDFPEEFDPQLDAAVGKIFSDLDLFIEQLQTLLESYEAGRQVREGWSVMLLGRPNAGKSSLFNRLHGEDRAIVTALPGTTRDLLETQIALGGLQLTLVDSAGLRKTPSAQSEEESTPSHATIEGIGIQRALDAAARAHLLLAVFDQARPWSEEDQQVLEACSGRPCVLIRNKADLPNALALNDAQRQSIDPRAEFAVSCKTGEGIDALRQWLQEYTEAQTPSQEMLLTNERQRDAVERALHFLHKATQEGAPLGPEFMAEDLRSARNALAQITGQVSSELILNTIFSRFCIGK